MSGYIHVLKDLLTDPRFRRSAKTILRARPVFESLALAETVTLGCLVKLWLTADSHISNADTLDFSSDEVDEFLGIAGIPELLGPNWLEVLNANQVRLPNYLAHNGIEARRKAQDAARQAKHRSKGSNGQALQDVTHPVTHERDTQSRDSVECAVTPSTLPLPAQPSPTQPSPESTMVERTRPTKAEPPEFSQFKLAYPKRAGSQPWGRALQAIHARLSEGHSWDEILDGVRRYADFCSATGKVGTEHVQQASRFCGPGQPPEFLQAWSLPATRAETRLAGNLEAAVEFMRRTETKQ